MCVLRLLISGSKVRVLDGPPILSGASEITGVPDLAFRGRLVPNQVPNRSGAVRCIRRPLFGIQRTQWRSVVEGFMWPSCTLTWMVDVLAATSSDAKVWRRS